MPFKPKMTPVIRATLDALEAVNRLQAVRLAAAIDDTERARIQAEHHDLLMALAAILHEAQFGPRPLTPTGLRLVRRNED